MQDFFIFKDKLNEWYNVDVRSLNGRGWNRMKEKKGIMKKLFSKSFFIELDDALTYPSAECIISAIEGYATECNELLKFESKVKPITFYLDDALFNAEIKMARGGYYISCSEI